MYDVSQKIKELRSGQKLTQRQFGQKVGIGPTMVSNLESGRQQPSREVILKIMQAFNLPSEYLLPSPNDSTHTAPIHHSYGSRLSQLRAAMGDTQVEFGQKIGLEQSNLSKVEKGERGLTRAQISMILHRFHVSPDWWQTGSGPMFSAASPRIPLVAWPDLSGPALDYILLPYLSEVHLFTQYAGATVGDIHGGDLIGLSPTLTERLSAGQTIAIDHQQGPFLALYLDSDSHWLTVAYDTEKTPFRLERRLCKGIYKVVGVVRRL